MTVPALGIGVIPEGAAPFAENPTLVPWLRRIEERQSFQVTKPPGV